MSVSTYCPKCGAECQEGDQFCKGCGNNLGSSTPVTPVTPATDRVTPITPSTESVTPITPATEPATPVTATVQPTDVTDRSEKSAATALFLNLFLGMFGIHRFYVGKIGTGILMLLTLGGLFIWSFIDMITIACSKFKDKNNRYLEFVSADPNTTSIKSGNTALLLALFLGPFGIHRFYVGKIGTGILMLITLGGLGFWTLIDVIVIACGNFTDKNGQYLNFRREAAPSSSTVALLAGLLITAFLAFMILIFSIIFIILGGMTDVARNQLDALRAHDYAKAYTYTSADFKRATTLDQFEAFVKNYPALSDNKDSTFNNRSINNGVGVISGTLEAKDGTKTPVTYQLITEEGEWKIVNIDVSAKDAGATTNQNQQETQDNQ